MAIAGVRILSIPVSDQDRSSQFYQEALGARVVSDVVMNSDMRWVELAFGESFPHLTLVTWFGDYGPGSLQGTVIETDDIIRDLSRLDDTGVEHSQVEVAPWGRYATFKDPDGNGWIIQATKV